MTVRNLKLGLTGDLSFSGGNFAMVSDNEAIGQACNCALRLVQGEWFLDPSIGVPYRTAVFVKAPSTARMKQVFTNALLSVKGVASVATLDLAVSKDRKLTVAYTALGSSGALITGGI
jgi:hypothetical protein